MTKLRTNHTKKSATSTTASLLSLPSYRNSSICNHCRCSSYSCRHHNSGNNNSRKAGSSSNNCACCCSFVRVLLTVAGIALFAAVSTVLFEDTKDNDNNTNGDRASRTSFGGGQQQRVPHDINDNYNDGRESTPTISIVLDERRDSWAYSIFTAGTVQRYSTLRYEIVHGINFKNVTLKETKELEERLLLLSSSLPQRQSGEQRQVPKTTATAEYRRRLPVCLLVGAAVPRLSKVSKRLSYCKTMLTNDEKCVGVAEDFVDVREYYYDSSYRDNNNNNEGVNNKEREINKKSAEVAAYLPLGPRIDFWEAFQRIQQQQKQQQQQQQQVPLASERPFVLNAMFSQSTSKSRKLLHKILDNRLANRTAYPSFVRIPDGWKDPEVQQEEDGTAATTSGGDEDQKDNGAVMHVDADEYAHVLLSSAFTLSPSGHNPECFRIFEAIEAGSIPVVALDDEYDKHACPNALGKMIDTGAPFIILNTWTELPKRLDELLFLEQATSSGGGGDGDDEETANRRRNEALLLLDERQKNLKKWYDKFMTQSVAVFEQRMLGDTVHPGFTDAARL